MNAIITATPLSDMARHQMVWDALRELGIKSIVVSFDGEGDDGAIDGVRPGYDEGGTVEGYDALCDALAAYRFDLPTSEHDPAPLALVELVEELSTAILSGNEVPDWCNDDGGHGELCWVLDGTDPHDEPARERVFLAVNQRHVTYDSTSFEYGKFGERVEE